MTQLILLNDDGSVKCRKPLPSIVDQSTIKGNGEGTKFAVDMNVVATALDGDGTRANAGHIDADLVVDAPLSGAGRSDSHLKVATATADAAGVVELTGSAQIPAEANRDDDAITPAGVKKLVRYIKPVGVAGALNATQTSADAIEVPMLSNVSCTGGTGGSPKFTIPMAGGGGCVVDVGAWGAVAEPYAPGQVVFSGMGGGCVPLPPGIYEVTARADYLGTTSYNTLLVWLYGSVVTGGAIPNCVPVSNGNTIYAHGRTGVAGGWTVQNTSGYAVSTVTQIKYLGSVY